MPSDVELLDAWRDGDKQAGSELFDRYFDSISRFFRNKINDGFEDLIQKTFLACVETRDRFRGEASFRTYLFGVAHNVLRKHFRTARREGERLDFGVTSVFDMAPSPSAIIAKHKEQQLLLEALRRIPLDNQIALELHYWEHMTAAEVGQVVGIPEGTAKTRIRRARQLLEDEMGKMAESRDQFTNTIQNLDEWANKLREQMPQRDDPSTSSG